MHSESVSVDRILICNEIFDVSIVCCPFYLFWIFTNLAFYYLFVSAKSNAIALLHRLRLSSRLNGPDAFDLRALDAWVVDEVSRFD